MINLKYDKLVLMGDIHIGHKEVDYERLKKYIKWVKRNKTHLFLMGDIFELSIPTHMPMTMWEQVMNPDEQLELAVEYFKPISDKIIGGIAGNHEIVRMRQVVSMNFMKYFLEERLGVPFFEWGFRKLKIKNQKYNCYLHHGSSSSINPQYQLKKAANILEDADLIAIGHDHRLWHSIESKITPSGYKKIHLVRTGGFLKYPEYMHWRFAPVAQLGCPVITFNKDIHNIKVDISDTIGKL